MNYPQEIETERLRLRWPEEADAEEIFVSYASDPTVTRFLLWRAHESADATREQIRSRVADRENGRAFGWLIRRKSDNQVLGMIGCREIESHILQFGYCISRSEWGHGYATEAARVAVPVWLAEPKIWRVQAYCDLENPASARVLEKAGLTCEGIVRRYYVAPELGPTPRDAHLYARVRES